MMKAETPNFVLTLLAACSNSVPVAGQEGETTLCEQLSGLLQDKKMVVSELNLLYSYKFGFSIIDALKFAGFEGELDEFLYEQKRFLVDGGFISMKPPTVVRTLPTAEEFLGKSIHDDDCASLADTQSSTPAKVLCEDFLGKKTDDEETASNADTESTTDDNGSTTDLAADAAVDIEGWHAIGSRLVDALDNIDNDVDDLRWKVLGNRVAAALDSDDNDNEDDGENVSAWRNVGCSMVAALSSDDGEDDDEWDSGAAAGPDGDDDREEDVAAWRDVGNRIVTGLVLSKYDDVQDIDEWCPVANETDIAI